MQKIGANEVCAPRGAKMTPKRARNRPREPFTEYLDRLGHTRRQYIIEWARERTLMRHFLSRAVTALPMRMGGSTRKSTLITPARRP